MMKKLKGLFILAVTAAFLSSCGGSGTNPTIDGVVGPNVNLLNGVVTVSMVFENIIIDGGATIPIPKYPNSFFQIGPDFQSGGTLLSLSVNAEDFLGNQGAGLDPQTLPGGRPLPGVAAGSLPAIAVAIPQLKNSVLYFGPAVMGLFVPFDGLDLAGSIVTFRFHNKEGAPVGNISLVGSDASGDNAGILMLMDPDLLGIRGKAARIDAYKKYYMMGYRK